jgi:hypothetical protein
MPYKNLPKSLWAKMDRCVADVKARNKKSGKTVDPYGVCYSSIVGAGVKKATEKRGG